MRLDMQISPQLESVLRLAGHMAGRRFPALAQGRTIGVDIGTAAEDDSNEVTVHDPRDHLALAQLRTHLAETTWPTVRAHVLLHARTLQMDGTPFTDALVAEFFDVTGRLDGLAVAVPFQPVKGPRALKLHRVRIVECPPLLQPLADELLVAFAQGIQSAGGDGTSAWWGALEIEPGIAPVPPATTRDPLFWAAAITPDDPQSDSNDKVQAHLEAFLCEGQFEGGLAFEAELRALAPDFSLPSLTALDTLLDRLHAEHLPQRDAFLVTPAGRNFVHLAGAYVGETLALAARAGAHWHTPEQLERLRPGLFAPTPGACDTLVCSFNGLGDDRYPFLPCDLVARRLFGDAGAAALDMAGAIAVSGIRAANRASMGDPGARWNATHDHGRMEVKAPAWFVNDPQFTHWFLSLPTLWRSGRVVWSNLVQANNQLFKPGPNDHPGEVVYDPAGRVDPRYFAGGASAMYRLKGLVLRNPLRAFLAEALTHERVRTSGIEIPPSLGARGLRTASVLFFRAHLPGGVLPALPLPILVSDEVPGVVMVIPSRFWPHLA